MSLMGQKRRRPSAPAGSARPLLPGADIDRTREAAFYSQMDERRRGQCEAVNRIVSGGNFGGGNGGVTRISEPVAQVPLGTPLTAADNRHSHRSSRPAGVCSFGNPSGDRLTAMYVSLCAVVPRWFLRTYRASTASWPGDSSLEMAMR